MHMIEQTNYDYYSEIKQLVERCDLNGVLRLWSNVYKWRKLSAKQITVNRQLKNIQLKKYDYGLSNI